MSGGRLVAHVGSKCVPNWITMGVVLEVTKVANVVAVCESDLEGRFDEVLVYLYILTLISCCIERCTFDSEICYAVI